MAKTLPIVVIGGGAAGMIAAWRAASLGAPVILLEKNPRLGIKILISGGGKCNITNGSDIRTMLKQFQLNEARFLKYSFHTFTNTALLDALHDEGVETYTRENGKVFPVSHNADDVVAALRRMMEQVGVDIRCAAPVKSVQRNPDGTFAVATSTGTVTAQKVIIATGGSSYQKTGTTGDGFRWMSSLGHTIIPIRPALSPILLRPSPPSAWQGTPVRDCALSATVQSADPTKQTVVASWTGDLLFTHIGISGPAALEVSRNAFLALEQGDEVIMNIDFYPELSSENLDDRLVDQITASPSRSLLTITEQLVPQRLAEYVLTRSRILFSKKGNQLSKAERKQLVSILKRCPIGTVREIPLDRGEVTAGGIDLADVDPTTMESRIVKGLYLCGEILDVAGPVGGYNLQAAFSTGYVAGDHAARSAP